MTRALGLDFGTTNTVLATRDAASGEARPLVFRHAGEAFDALRSALCFWQPPLGKSVRDAVEAGPWAIQRYIDDPGDCRFLQSLKTFAASPHFPGAYVFAQKFQFEDLLDVFLARLRAHADGGLDNPPRRVVAGRPVAWAGASPDPALATARYTRALRGAGFDDIVFVYEPVAAAFHFARRLRGRATILVADFGGGTTDYSIMRFDRTDDAFRAEPLGHGGVGIAGDTFDYRIIDHAILPALGKGGRYRGMGKILELPTSPFASFGRWNQLSILKTSPEFRDLKKTLRACLEPEKIQRFIDIVEDDMGYPLYRAVSAAKARLSSASETALEFAPLGADFRATIRRDDFERWIAGDLARMEWALDGTLRDAGLGAAGIDRVFLTGGTSFVPAVRNIFERRFGAERIESGDELVSIANGLAMIGERDDAEAWAAKD